MTEIDKEETRVIAKGLSLRQSRAVIKGYARPVVARSLRKLGLTDADTEVEGEPGEVTLVLSRTGLAVRTILQEADRGE